MQFFPREGENALAMVAPRPASDLSISPFGGFQGPRENGKQRTSSLESPIMLLAGHQSAIYAMKFNPAGTVVASGSQDREIFLWNVHGDCKNFMVLKGHKNAILDLQWTSDGFQLISASTDKTLKAWDVETGKQVKKMAEHNSFVNSCCPSRRGPPLVVSGSDDGTSKLLRFVALIQADMRKSTIPHLKEKKLFSNIYEDNTLLITPRHFEIKPHTQVDRSADSHTCWVWVVKLWTISVLLDPLVVYARSSVAQQKLWDMRQRGAIHTFPDKYQITAVSFSDASDKIYTGGVDNEVKVWDLRRNEVTMTLEGHQDMITGMQLSPDGSYLLTNAMDCKLFIWDMRPFTPQNRCVKILEGHEHNFEKNLLKCGWSPDGSKVTAGSSNRMMYIWDTTSRRILYKLPGHAGSVNESAFHPTEPITGSCSSDKQLYLGEI